MSIFIKTVLCFAVVMSFVTFFIYGTDKKKAVDHRWRVPEKVLLGLAFAGGAYGALLGMIFFHHKTRKIKFQVLVPMAVVMWTVILIWVAGGLASIGSL